MHIRALVQLCAMVVECMWGWMQDFTLWKKHIYEICKADFSSKFAFCTLCESQVFVYNYCTLRLVILKYTFDGFVGLTTAFHLQFSNLSKYMLCRSLPYAGLAPKKGNHHQNTCLKFPSKV